jgi:hypothetical protein
MITDEQFKDYIGKMSDIYESVKDKVYLSVPVATDAMDIIGFIAEFRDIACTALRESHTTKNFEDN